MYFQKEHWDLYPLTSLGNGVFTPAIPYEEQARRARRPLSDIDYFRLRFGRDGAGKIAYLQWHHDPNTGPEEFVRDAVIEDHGVGI